MVDRAWDHSALARLLIDRADIDYDCPVPRGGVSFLRREPPEAAPGGVEKLVDPEALRHDRKPTPDVRV